jgi:CHAT domain-containing protein
MAVHGIAEYEQISRNYGIAELNEKQKISEFIAKQPNAFKNTNMKLTKVALKEILSDFMTNQKSLSFQSLIVLSVFYQRPIYIVHEPKSIYLSFLPFAQDGRPIIIYVNPVRKGKYKWFSKESEIDEQMNTMKNTMFAMEHYDHALKPISQYKLDELKHIQQTLHIQIDESIKKPKKQDIYDSIVQFCSI